MNEVSYKSTEFPIRRDGILDVSVDVIIIDEDNDFMNIGYYDYQSNKWKFHTDVLSDAYERGLDDFCWIYKPIYLKYIP